MHNSMSHQSEQHIDHDGAKASKKWKNSLKSGDRHYVEALLDISEEYSVKERDAYEVQKNPVDWEEEALQGWERCCAPPASLCQAQRNRTNVKAERNNTKTWDTLGNNKTIFEGEQQQFIPNKTQPHHLHPIDQCLCFKKRGAGKVPLTGTLVVLPPVRRPPSSRNVGNVPVSSKRKKRKKKKKKRIALYPKVGEDHKTLDIETLDSAVHQINQETLTSQYRSEQHQSSLLSVPVSRRPALSCSPLNYITLPRAQPILGRNLRHGMPFRHYGGIPCHRAHSNFKPRLPKRLELPKLLRRTRVPLPTPEK